MRHRNSGTRAVSVGNPREFLQAEKEDQEMAEACKRLIKNCIICWNYLYLSQKLEEIKDTAGREGFSTRWPMARWLPGSTSTCSASMTSRTRSCETASEFDAKNWWTKWGSGETSVIWHSVYCTGFGHRCEASESLNSSRRHTARHRQIDTKPTHVVDSS